MRLANFLWALIHYGAYSWTVHAAWNEWFYWRAMRNVFRPNLQVPSGSK